MKELIILTGKPGSGKTTYAKKLQKERNAVVISTDEIRLQLFGTYMHFEDWDLILKEFDNQILNTLLNTNDVVIVLDAVFMSRSDRVRVVTKFCSFVDKIVLVWLNTSQHLVEKQNQTREKICPPETFVHMCSHYMAPTHSEFRYYNKVICVADDRSEIEIFKQI